MAKPRITYQWGLPNEFLRRRKRRYRSLSEASGAFWDSLRGGTHLKPLIPRLCIFVYRGDELVHCVSYVACREAWYLAVCGEPYSDIGFTPHLLWVFYNDFETECVRAWGSDAQTFT